MKGQIVLIGMMGVGKTAVGQEMARQLGVSFTDIDAEIERAAAMSIPEIFARDGEAFFRDRESMVLSRLLGGPHGVISTGGGAWIQARNRSLIREAGLAVWLDADLDTLWERVRQRPTRPLLMTGDPKGTLATLIESRSPVYARAGLRVQSDSKADVETTARRVIASIRDAHPEFLEAR
ncbi:shikimate kinase [Paracoccus aerodenitrificans]|uniref:shikimate kinase n=1 Tax=Paracoccus aerodenitrificans TaxID=3017781 RepID=UPI0022F0CCC2|nr:shikimate kinase [Paracoccus aerodenitrificans]WBU62653.1 shikimate kinase [Paracoccus aerodenitrificans]